MKVKVRCIVSGKVQGVYYRQSTLRMAQAFGVNGWVKNLPNGDVELFACGDEPDVVRLKKWLWQGPLTAKVTHVECRDCDDEDPGEFSVVANVT